MTDIREAMAEAILRVILARPLLSLVDDKRIPGELWDAAYNLERATHSSSASWGEFAQSEIDYYDALEKYASDLPAILEKLSEPE